MLYLLDANALITAHRTWYALHRVPEFWKWLLFHGTAGSVKIPGEIYTEIESGTDDLANWVGRADTKRALRLNEVSEPTRVRTVLSHYGAALTASDLITIGQDPFLIAAALGHADRRVITAEVSKPGRQGANRHVPNVCDDCGVVWMTPIEFINDLDFSTGWDS